MKKQAPNGRGRWGRSPFESSSSFVCIQRRADLNGKIQRRGVRPELSSGLFCCMNKTVTEQWVVNPGIVGLVQDLDFELSSACVRPRTGRTGGHLKTVAG